MATFAFNEKGVKILQVIDLTLQAGALRHGKLGRTGEEVNCSRWEVRVDRNVFDTCMVPEDYPHDILNALQYTPVVRGKVLDKQHLAAHLLSLEPDIDEQGAAVDRISGFASAGSFRV